MITVEERLRGKKTIATTVCSKIYEVQIDGKLRIAKIPQIEEVAKLEREAFRLIAARNKQIEEIRGAKVRPSPHLVRLIDEVRFLDGEGFLLEKLMGLDLKTVLEMRLGNVRFSRIRRLKTVYEIIQGIDQMHSAGIFNRDIKTDNVMFDQPPASRLGSNTRAVVFDFGLATKKDPQTQEEIEQLEKHCGTPEVFAPEIFEINRYSIAQETYALGALMYEVFTERQFRDLKGVQVGQIPQKIKEEIPRPSRVAQVDRDIEDIIMMAIANDPSKRFRSATQMKEAVFDALLRRTCEEIEF
jgi:serine/threonine-protein kinase